MTFKIEPGDFIKLLTSSMSGKIGTRYLTLYAYGKDIARTSRTNVDIGKIGWEDHEGVMWVRRLQRLLIQNDDTMLVAHGCKPPLTSRLPWMPPWPEYDKTNGTYSLWVWRSTPADPGLFTGLDRPEVHSAIMGTGAIGRVAKWDAQKFRDSTCRQSLSFRVEPTGK